MSEAANSGPTGAATRINVDSDNELGSWARKLDATPDQIRSAVAAVGDLASDVEEHLKGSRSTTNAERMRQAQRQ